MLQLSSFVQGSRQRIGFVQGGRPLLNEVSTVTSPSRYNRGGRIDYKELWRRFKNSPELVAILSTIVMDAFGDRPKWEDLNGRPLGRNTRIKAEKFWREQSARETVCAIAYDTLLCGDGFLWLGKPTKDQLVAAYKEAASKFDLPPIEIKEDMIDEDFNNVRAIDYVAASTMDVEHDSTEVTGYVQRAAGGEREFTKEEIVHFRYMTVDGRVMAFSPAQSLLAEIMLLDLVKGNMLSFMRNGGSPDKVFVLPEETADSVNHRYLVDILTKYKRVENFHGNLVVSGKLEIQDLAGNPKDMEYKELALYIASNMAFAYKLPSSRIPYLIGSAANKGDNGGISDAGYWQNIGCLQDYFEDLLNQFVFNPMFKANVRFSRKYKQDEVREAQTFQMNVDSATKLQSMLQMSGKQLKLDKALALLGMSEEDVEEAPMPTMLDAGSGYRQGMLPGSQVMKNPDAQVRADRKRVTMNRKGTGAAVTKP